jgi:transcriptional regulator with XRE-family HTH domain
METKSKEQVRIELGDKVKKLREQIDLNQAQIAEFLGIDQTTISKCENGERQFTVSALESLSNLFGCTLEDLLGDEKEVNPLIFAFRADAITDKDLIGISEINRIALNIREMKKLMEVA